MDPKLLLTRSLRSSPHREVITNILAAALEAVDPSIAVSRHMKRVGDRLQIGDSTYDLSRTNHVFVIGFGKASIPMFSAAAEILGEDLSKGIALSKSYPTSFIKEDHRFTFLLGGHPIPNEQGRLGTTSILNLLNRAAKNDLVIFLISGGGSALLTSPVSNITLDDLQSLTKQLLACGASIHEMNCLRKHLSKVKGGGLARFAMPARVATLILSDVIGDPLDVIASGPTVPDPTTYGEAIAILNKYQLFEHIPQTIRDHLTQGIRGEILETPKQGDPIFDRVQNYIVGNNLQSAQAAVHRAKAYGFTTLLLTTSLQGEARSAGQFLSSIARQIYHTGDPIPRPACLVAGGETTVTISGDGLGGRNQELALATATELAGFKDILLLTLATDGDDGPTDAAGAVVTGETLAEAHKLGLYPLDFLNNNDSYHFFEPLEDLLRPGPTATNVGDLTFIFLF